MSYQEQKNNIKSWYVIQFRLSSSGLQQNCPTCKQIKNNFTYIQKMESVNSQIQIILGLEQMDEFLSLYYLNLSYESAFKMLQCQADIYDFTIVNWDFNFDIILYLCKNQLRYLINNVDYLLKLIVNKRILETNYNRSLIIFLIGLNKIFLSFIFRLKIRGNANFSYNYRSFCQFDCSNSGSAFFRAQLLYLASGYCIFLYKMETIIPLYGSFNLIQTQQQNGLIFMVYQQDSQIVYAIYDWYNKKFPLFMKGGLNFSASQIPSSIAINISQETEGRIYELIQNGSIYGYYVYPNTTLFCNMNKHRNFSLPLFVYNNGNQSEVNFLFIYIPRSHEFLGLFIFVLIIFLIAIIFYWYKTKDYYTDEVYFMDEIEMDS